MQAINENPRKSLLEGLPENLRASFQKVRETIPCTQVAGGIPKGALTEISGTAGGGKTELLLRFLAENPELRVAWVEEDFSIYPCALPQHGVAMERVLFVEAEGEDALWSAHQILRSQIFEVVVLNAWVEEEVKLKRLQMDAEKSGSCLILVAEEARRSGTWPITLQLDVSRENENTDVQILKNRRGRVWQSTG